jgi:secondary thiamine-phosphate synthase enzyme
MSSTCSSILSAKTGWFQRTIELNRAQRGCHIVTEEVLAKLPEIKQFNIGLCHLMIMHTSAALSLNENADPDVRKDMEMFLNRLAPEDLPYKHIEEGPDDMPAHIKSALLGHSLTIPITEGRLNLGTWQGIWLCEHRNRASGRRIVVTLNGALKA